VITSLGLLCGFFLTVGLFTRAAAIIQIPVLFVAVFFVNLPQVAGGAFELILSIVMLLLLFLFAIKGSGPCSADEYFRSGAAYDARAKSKAEHAH
jgi:putative oxidoreductase